MKITRVETFFIDIGWSCWKLLKMYIDEGVTGLGECTLESKEETVVGALRDLSRSLIGQDPLLIERHWQEMYRNSPWQEEPIPSDNLDALAKVAENVKIPLATGERIYTKWGFRPLLERQIVDIIQPDICHVGGILECRKIAAMAEAYDVPVAPHNPNGPVGMTAAVHLAACTPNFLALESVHTRDWQWELLDAPLEIVDGHVVLPTKPGLGIDLNEDGLRKHKGLPPDAGFWKNVFLE